MTIEMRPIDEGLGADDEPLVQIDVRYTSDAAAELHEAADVDPLLVVALARDPATVEATLQLIASRSQGGEPTPVRVSEVDALGLRDRLEQLALDRYPS